MNGRQGGWIIRWVGGGWVVLIGEWRERGREDGWKDGWVCGCMVDGRGVGGGGGGGG